MNVSVIKRACFTLASFWSVSSFAVEAHYTVGMELKPLPLIMTSLSGGQGLGASLELTSRKYDNWVFVTNAEAYRGPRNDEGIIPEKVENLNTSPVEETDYFYQQIGMGIRNYSNRQDDSYYFGGEFSLTSEVQSFEVSGASYDIVSQSYRPNAEFGYRWVWDNGAIFRLGSKITYVTNVRNRFDGDEQELSESWRDAFIKALEAAEQNNDIYANIDIGIGYSF